VLEILHTMLVKFMSFMKIGAEKSGTFVMGVNEVTCKPVP
jgi:hypothetical protein